MASAAARGPLEVRLLGELRIRRAGVPDPLALPPSKKTRALLAYLLLKGRPQRRDALCSLFWDVTDDPRGALRWSLSKLRALLDEAHATRVVADRDHVGIELCGAEVDVLRLRAELGGPSALADSSTERLEQLAAEFAGELMEGLDLPDFDEYQAFCVGERERTRKLRAALLEELCKRLSDQPERALPHARTWAQLDPLRLQARETVLRLLLAADLRAEAAQHYESARRIFEELGAERTAELARLWSALRTRSERPARELAPAAAASVADARATHGHGQDEPASPAGADRASRDRPSAIGRAPLIGREREQSLLRESLERVRSEGRQRVLLLGGEPGIGKTRLLQALLREAQRAGATVLHGAAFEGEAGRPYGPFIDGLRALIAEEERRAPGMRTSEVPSALTQTLAPLLPELGTAQAEGSRDRLFSAVSDFIAARARAAPPVVIALDDVQWLDPASAELLHYLARGGRYLPLLVALCARSDEASDNAALSRVLRGMRRERVVEELALAPLPADAIRALVAPHVTSDAEAVVAQCGGNPLFALELARVGARGSERLPASVSDAVRERVERLVPEAADALRWGAVLGGTFEFARLRELTALPPEALVTALEALELSSLLVREEPPSDAYRFAHEVVRRVVYADLSEPRRRLMHRRVAHVLRERGELSEARVAELAHHATLAHDHDLAASACSAAARRCLRLFANDEAVKVARRGLRHAEHLDGLERIQRTIELLEVELLCARPEDLETQKARLRELGDRALAEGAAWHARRAYFVLSMLNWEQGAWSEARRDMLQSELISRSADERQQATSLAETARCLIMLERDLPQAGTMLAEAEAHARRLNLLLSALDDARGMLLAHQGKRQEALARFESAERLARAESDPLLEYHVLEHRAMAEIDDEAYEPACALAPRMVELADKLREGSEAPAARTLAALARYGLGELDQGELQAGFEALRVVDAKYRLAYALSRAALLDLSHGRAERALARAQEAREIAELLERPSELWLCSALIFRAASELGQRERAEAAKAALGSGAWDCVSAPLRRRGEALLARRKR